ncbi:unnamed protein product [Didymodactylos carnosus]|uniref:Uncharacterized protein n=1 Tax=Didymodactylos carnosus TaxID=1234261 RepID=A0A815SRR2_9BILA|nr:unnamed protein product [Didymodactylos carnosus]CAF1493363.1 unnamed protein product [Didymodactylos carnosus]CAF4155995.1 unnamed protein product [Didymodactylos carnosus]CAF4356145.1 unnamed protein product [Didymodactylos carnosus]
MPVVYGINTRAAAGTKCTPYEVMLGEKTRLDCVFWDNIRVDGVVGHDDLPNEIHEMIQNAENVKDDQNVGSGSNSVAPEVIADIDSLEFSLKLIEDCLFANNPTSSNGIG